MSWWERHKLLVAMMAAVYADFRPSECGREYYWKSGSVSAGTSLIVYSKDGTAKKAGLHLYGLRICGARRLFAHLAGIKTGNHNSILREACNVPIGDWKPGPVNAGGACEYWMDHPVLGRLDVKAWYATGEDANLYHEGKSISGASGLYNRITLHWSGAQKRKLERELIAKQASEWSRIGPNTFETTWRGDKVKIWRIGEQYHISIADRPLHYSYLEAMRIWQHVCREVEMLETQQTVA